MTHRFHCWTGTMPPQTRQMHGTPVKLQDDMKLSEDYQSFEKDKQDVASSYYGLTQAARAAVVIFSCLCIYYSSSIQFYVDKLWDELRERPFFISAYFETVYVTVIYGVLIAVYPYAMHYIPFLQRFKINSDVTYVHKTVIGILMEAVVYMAPLLAADAVIIKRYWDVPESEWEPRKQQWIQTTRALPVKAPSFLILCIHVIASVFVFDAIFFAVHYILHKNFFLYKHLHAVHHEHDIMHAHVTNQLSIVERVLLIASANYALKLFRCHPLTRITFVPVFLWFLIENHSGYDLPWAPHRLAPSGLMGGPAKHHAHHMQGSRHYQPFFNYLDHWLERIRVAKKNSKQNM